MKNFIELKNIVFLYFLNKVRDKKDVLSIHRKLQLLKMIGFLNVKPTLLNHKKLITKVDRIETLIKINNAIVNELKNNTESNTLKEYMYLLRYTSVEPELFFLSKDKLNNILHEWLNSFERVIRIEDVNIVAAILIEQNNIVADFILECLNEHCRGR